MSKNSEKVKEKQDLPDGIFIVRKEKAKPPSNPFARVVDFPEPFPGPMADAVEAILKTSIKPQPELAAMATLSAMAAVCGNLFHLWDGLRLNLYFLGVGKSGIGKDASLKAARKLARGKRAMSGPKLIGTPASGEGLEDSLIDIKATYCVMDEIGHFFCIMNDPKAPSHKQENARKILELFTASNDLYTTRALASKPSRVINHPAFNLLGMTTPERMGQSFDPNDFADGTAGRFLFVITSHNPSIKEVESEFVVPDTFHSAAEQIDKNAILAAADGIVIQATKEAKEYLSQLSRQFDHISKYSPSPWEGALSVRSVEKLKRIAGILAAWANPDKPVITVEHVEWAAQFVRASNACVLQFVGEYMHTGKIEANASVLKKMLQLCLENNYEAQRLGEIRALNEGWVAHSMLLRECSKRFGLAGNDYHIALGHLEEIGDVEVNREAAMRIRPAPRETK
ncbi:DUF3987 domain-containing protein [Pseudogulbenkiania sp. MAI-1]|uniref:DUF3987 domain-containing protein n=1 Tax=Pseudogulbenkiania sp. MAI-1 TaxID=990370 RepID=UPI0004AC9233|nr:DUF3987 domain-containing protein [Pseudogulbenkiania sp. MAI-1]